MKLIHISDLHIGKRFKERSLIEDQKAVLDQIVEITKDEAPDAVIIAGDIYDKPVPPAEAVLLLDDFMVALAGCCDHIIVISGNHDSGERMSFGRRFMEKSGVHMASRFEGELECVRLADEHGEVAIWMLPYIRTVDVRTYHEDVERDDHTGAIRKVLESAGLAAGEGTGPESKTKKEGAGRNVLVAHQYVTGAIRSDSEEVPIGGLVGVDAEVFDAFDYVALGHLHKSQYVGDERIRYSGTPLKYSFAEEGDDKHILVVDIGAPGKPAEGGGPESGVHAPLEVRAVPLHPLRQVRKVSGTFDELMRRAPKESERERDAFISAELADEEYIPDGIRRLRTVYPNILEVRYPNAQGGAVELPEEGSAEERSPLEYVEEFFLAMRGREMSDEQKKFAEDAIEKIWGKES